MPRPNDVGVGTAVIVLNGHHEILLGKRKGAHRAGHWSCPGGWLDRADSGTVVAVCREALEETGLVLDKMKVKQMLWTTEDHPELGVRTVTLYHLAWPGFWEGEVLLMEPNKCEGWQWFDLDDLPSPLFPGVKYALEKLQERLT